MEGTGEKKRITILGKRHRMEARDLWGWVCEIESLPCSAVAPGLSRPARSQHSRAGQGQRTGYLVLGLSQGTLHSWWCYLSACVTSGILNSSENQRRVRWPSGTLESQEWQAEFPAMPGGRGRAPRGQQGGFLGSLTSLPMHEDPARVSLWSRTASFSMA